MVRVVVQVRHVGEVRRAQEDAELGAGLGVALHVHLQVAGAGPAQDGLPREVLGVLHEHAQVVFSGGVGVLPGESAQHAQAAQVLRVAAAGIEPAHDGRHVLLYVPRVMDVVCGGIGVQDHVEGIQLRPDVEVVHRHLHLREGIEAPAAEVIQRRQAVNNGLLDVKSHKAPSACVFFGHLRPSDAVLHSHAGNREVRAGNAIVVHRIDVRAVAVAQKPLQAGGS